MHMTLQMEFPAPEDKVKVMLSVAFRGLRSEHCDQRTAAENDSSRSIHGSRSPYPVQDRPPPVRLITIVSEPHLNPSFKCTIFFPETVDFHNPRASVP
jgi:hypothetical protein